MQFLSGIIDAPVERPRILETTAMGAAWLAGHQAGILPDMQAFSAEWAVEARFEPSMPSAEREAKYAAWQRAVQATIGFAS
jgi:glycerol kinase